MELQSIDNFQQLDDNGAEVVKKEKKTNPVMEQAKAAFEAKVTADPSYRESIRTRSNDLEVTRSLAFSDKGGIVLDKANGPVTTKSGKERDGAVVPTAGIVGYTVKNIGTEPIAYDTVACHKDENGLYVEEVVHRVLNAGQSADLPKQYFTALCARPEFSLKISNGELKKSSKKANKTLADELKSWYFKGDGIAVNDDNFKVNISTETVGADGTTKWVVKPEYVETFGTLENPKVKAASAPRAKKETYEKKDIAAFYLQELMKKEQA